MTTKPNKTSPEDDLAFMKSIVQGDGRPPVTLAICYLAGGLLYGIQCLFHIGQILGVIRWPEFANLAFLIGILASAAPPDEAARLFTHLCVIARQHHPVVATGRFGANMQVALVNDGPVTFWLQTPETV